MAKTKEKEKPKARERERERDTGPRPRNDAYVMMLVITFFGGLTALGLGITGQYLWLTLENARGRPSFVVRTTEAFNDADQRRVETSARNSS